MKGFPVSVPKGAQDLVSQGGPAFGCPWSVGFGCTRGFRIRLHKGRPGFVCKGGPGLGGTGVPRLDYITYTWGPGFRCKRGP